MAKIGIDIPVDAADDVFGMLMPGTNLGGPLPRAGAAGPSPAPNISSAGTPPILPTAQPASQVAPPPKQRPGWERVLGEIGNVAGNALLPTVMPYIPGSDANKQWKQAQANEAEERQANLAQKAAQTEATRQAPILEQQRIDAEKTQQERQAEQAAENATSKSAQGIAQENMERTRLAGERQNQEAERAERAREDAATERYREGMLGLEREKVGQGKADQKQAKIDAAKNKIIQDEQNAFKAMQNDVTNKKLKQNTPDFYKRYAQIKGTTAQKLLNLGQTPTLDPQTWQAYLMANGGDAKKAAQQADQDGYHP